ncbi:MAG: aquaporin [Candidatus Saccharimonadales bacterium]
MATKAKTTSKARTAKTRPAAAKAAKTTTKKTTVVKTAPVAAVRPVTRQKTYRLSNDLSGAQVIGEMVGTFLFVSLIMASGGNPFLIGIALIGLVAAFFSISGAHLNPAITFGLWTMRKVSATKMLFYLMAQFVGAILAVFAVSAFAGTSPSISLSSFFQWDWRIVFAELLGMAVFMFMVAAAAERAQTDNSKAVTIGLGLFVALVISTSLLQQAISTENTKFTAEQQKESSKDISTPRILKVGGTILNPAAAFSQPETESQNSALGTQEKSTGASRLTIETILGAFAGAAIGGWLYLLLARNTEEGRL